MVTPKIFAELITIIGILIIQIKLVTAVKEIDKANRENKILDAEIDFDKVKEARKNGFMGLGQPIKSFRDNPFNPLNYMNKDYLDSLGDLKKDK